MRAKSADLVRRLGAVAHGAAARATTGTGVYRGLAALLTLVASLAAWERTRVRIPIALAPGT